MTVKTLTDLTGLKEANLAELEQMGIKSVADLSKALENEDTVKQIIKELSGVGPKTVMKWQGQLKVTSTTEAVSKVEKSADKKADKAGKKADRAADKAKAGKAAETSVEVVEEGTDEGVYVPNIKPVLDKETTDGLAKRAIISGRRPAFKRQEWFRYAKLGESWRRPKGIHSKMKRNLARRPPVVDIGFRGPASVRNLHPSGFEEVLVHNAEGLDAIDPKVQAVRIGGTVGTKKRMAIEERAAELGIRVLNRMV
ncbi:MAG: 50S ribosomal protein L32e [Candidatus Methanomethylophilaceae archaeon]